MMGIVQYTEFAPARNTLQSDNLESIHTMPDDFEVLQDHQGLAIRLTNERWAHILDHPEMAGQQERLAETLVSPDIVTATVKDEAVHAYHHLYDTTPITRKYMVVVVKMLADDAFVVTAFYSSRVKKGDVIWQK